MPDFYEFFAGGGMARAGLGDNWNCLFANDFDYKKAQIYRRNWGDRELLCADIKTITASHLPGCADLAWASFPCQDLSLAGGGAGLRGERSGTFWPFWNVIKSLAAINRKPTAIVLENVCGTLTSHGGEDFAAICGALRDADYRFGALVIDAALFVPQSRPRLFLIGISREVDLLGHCISTGPTTPFHSRALQIAHQRLAKAVKEDWLWWNVPAPAARSTSLADLIEEEPRGVTWHPPQETKRLLAMMSSVNRAKVEAAVTAGRRVVGGIYKRTRVDESGFKVQRAEVRFDDVAGCLRTPAGGSSRQVIIVVDGNNIRTRLISTRETARLMGLPDAYVLPENYNEGYHITGDGVAVPAVRYIAKTILEPILFAKSVRKVAA